MRGSYFEDSILEGGDACHILSENQGVYVLRSFQRALGLQITQVSNDLMFRQDSPSTENVPGHAGDLHGLPDIVQLGE